MISEGDLPSTIGRVTKSRNGSTEWPRSDFKTTFCTDPESSVGDILEAVADRAAIEQVFHDVKEVLGAGQQQLRNVWTNVGAWNLLLWLHTLVELWVWHRDESELIDRTARP